MATDMTIANTIAQQIGGRAFVMMGTRYKLGDVNSLTFDIKGSRKANKVRVILEPSDTYTVIFYKIANRGLNVTEVAKVEGVYHDSLHTVIESRTGLYLSLGIRH